MSWCSEIDICIWKKNSMKMAQTNSMFLHLFISALLLMRAALLPINDQKMAPSMTDIERIFCPVVRPFKCLPYGACCRGSEFCHSGLCESCFPREKPGSELLDWCRVTGQYNVSTMRSPACRLACQDVFTSLQLAVIADKGHEAGNRLPTDHRCSSSQDVKENTSTLTDTVSPRPLGARQQTDTNGQGSLLKILVAGNVVTLVLVIILVCISWEKILAHISHLKNLISGSRNDNQQLPEDNSLETTSSIAASDRTRSTPSTSAAVEDQQAISPIPSNEPSDNDTLPSSGQATSNTPSNHTQTDLLTSLNNGNEAGDALMGNRSTDCNRSSKHTQTDLLTSLSNGNEAGDALMGYRPTDCNRSSNHTQTDDTISLNNGNEAGEASLSNRPTVCNRSSNHTQTDDTTSLNNGNEADNVLMANRLNDCKRSTNRGRYSSEPLYYRNNPSDISLSLGKPVRNASTFERRTHRNKSSDEQASGYNKQKNYNELKADTENAVNDIKEGNLLNTGQPLMSSEDPSSSIDNISARAFYDGPNEVRRAEMNDDRIEDDFIAVHDSPTQPKETTETMLNPAPQGSKVREHSPIETGPQHNVDVSAGGAMSNKILKAKATSPTQDPIEPEDGNEETPLLNHDIKPQEESKFLETN